MSPVCVLFCFLLGFFGEGGVLLKCMYDKLYESQKLLLWKPVHWSHRMVLSSAADRMCLSSLHHRAFLIADV